MFTLTNNHIIDHEEHGLYTTIEQLNYLKINHVGEGKSIHEADKLICFDIKGKRYGAYVCCA